MELNTMEAELRTKVQAAVRLLAYDKDEDEALNSLSIIGPLADDGKTWLEPDIALPILEAATDSRVSVRRLWNLVMVRGHFKAHSSYCIPGVAYGAVEKYLSQFPWMCGDLELEEIETLNDKGTPEDIGEIMRSRGYWMWMRPDRTNLWMSYRPVSFPIEPNESPQSYLAIMSSVAQPVSHGSVAALPVELLHTIAQHLSLSDVISLAATSRRVYNTLVGSKGARDALAKAYMRSQARWCLPYGKDELKWWHDKKGDDALGWEYLRRCYAHSHSMRNRRRIWKAAESIEEECEKEERAQATGESV
ncbi:hypothetical protein FRC07_000487 [Ceratobasidium sp. 392]|nr:hypothetical protein FRC07_000487 [Ceratobasidium sp. 392]